MAVTGPAASETWTGTSGSWPSQWTVLSGTGTLSSNTGLLTPAATANAFSRADLTSSSVGPFSDLDVVVTVTGKVNSVVQYAWVGIDANSSQETGGGNSTNEIYVGLAYGTTAANGAVSLWQGTTQIGSSVTKSLTGTTSYRIRIRRFNGTVYGKVWANNAVEPGAWDFTVAMTSMPQYGTTPSPTGNISVGTQNSSTATARAFTFDDLEAWVPQAMETWTGSNGAAWPSQWGPVIGGGSATIQSNLGQITNQAGSYAGSHVVMTGMPVLSTFDVFAYIKMTTASVEQGLLINIADDNSASAFGNGPYNGYTLNLYFSSTAASSTIQWGGTFGGNSQNFGSATTKTLSGNTTYLVRAQLTSAGVLQARVWPTSAGEPTTWDSSFTLTGTPLSGRVSLGGYNGNDGTARSATFGYLSVDGTVAVATPVASFTIGTPSGSAPLSTTFTDTSTNTPTSWLWDFGDGTTSTTQNPSHLFSSAGTYTVTLTATNGSGSNSVTHTVAANGGSTITVPFAETWTGSNGSSWQPYWTTVLGTVTIQSNTGQLVTGTGGYVDARADVTGMTAQADTEVVVTFSGTSSGVEQLVFIGINADPNDTSAQAKSTKELFLQLNYNATASSSTFALYQGSTMLSSQISRTLVGTTSYRARLRRFNGMVYARLWASASPEPTAWDITYALSGAPYPNPTGVVSVQAANGNDAISRTFQFDNLEVWTPLAMETWTGTNGAAWPSQWSAIYGGGTGASATIQSNMGQVVSQSGNGYYGNRVVLTGMNSSQTFDVSGTVAMTGSGIEQGFTVTVADDNTNAGGTPQNGYELNAYYNDTAAYSNFSLYTLSNGGQTMVTNEYGMTLAGSTTYGFRLQLTSAKVLQGRIWDLSTPEPTTWMNSYAISGTAYIGRIGLGSYADGNGNSRTANFDNLLVNGSTPSTVPVASFTASALTGSAPLTVNFTDTSTNSPTSWSWNFGDGTTSTLQNPSHTFYNQGGYTVSLTATNANGSGSTSSNIIVGTPATTALPVIETFTGSNGAAWPNYWALVNGSGSIQSNAGKLTTGSFSYATGREDLYGMPSTGDTEIVVTFTGSSSGVEQYVFIGLNGDANSNTTQGVSANELFLQVNYTADGTSSSLAVLQAGSQIGSNISRALVGTTSYRARVRRQAGTFYARVWALSSPEPTTWDFTIALSSTINGVVSLACGNGNDGIARTFTFDDVEVWQPLQLETFTGSNGAAWPNTWAVDDTPNATIQANQGQLISPAVSYAATRAIVTGTLIGPAFEMYTTVTGSTASVDQSILIGTGRSSDLNSTTSVLNDFAVRLIYSKTPASSTIEILHNNNDFVSPVTLTLNAATAYRLRLMYYGTFVGAKVWAATAVEPSTWTVSSVSYAMPLSGNAAIVVQSGSDGTALTFNFDDVLINGTLPATPTLPYVQTFTGNNGTLASELLPYGYNGKAYIVNNQLMVSAVADGSFDQYGVSLSQKSFVGDQGVNFDVTLGASTVEQYNYVELRASQVQSYNYYLTGGFFFTFGTDFAAIGVHRADETKLYYVDNWNSFDLTQAVHVSLTVTGTPGAVVNLWLWQSGPQPIIPSISFAALPDPSEVVTGGLMLYQSVNSTPAPVYFDNITYYGISGSALPYTDTWTGSNGAPWPSPWSTSVSAGTGGTALIQSNAGVLTSGTTSSSWMKATLTSRLLPAGDLDVTTQFTIGTQVSSAFNIGINCSTDQYSGNPGEMPNNGYTVNFSVSATATSGSFDMWKVSSGTQSQLYATTTITLTAGTQYAIRFQRVGTAVRFRVWVASGSEPSTWTATVTDSATMLAYGFVQLAVGNANGQTLTVDNLTVKVPASAPYSDSWTLPTYAHSYSNRWPGGWTFHGIDAPNNGVFGQIVNGAGVLNAGANGYAGVRAALESLILDATDVYVTVIVTSNQFADVSINGSGSGGGLYGFYNAPIGYTLELDSATNSLILYQVTADGTGDGGTTGVNQLTSVAFSFTNNTAYRVRLQRIGTTLRSKVWLQSNSEPVAWTITATVTAGVTGFVSLGQQNYTNAFTSSTFDDLVISIPTSTGDIKVYTSASGFLAKPIKVWNGTAWVAKPVKRYDGSAWDQTTY